MYPIIVFDFIQDLNNTVKRPNRVSFDGLNILADALGCHQSMVYGYRNQHSA